MPVAQPNLDYYADKSLDAYKDIVELLAKKYGIDNLEDEKYDSFPLIETLRPCYQKNCNELYYALRNIFVNQGCADF